MNASHRKVQTLQLIYAICQEQEQRGSDDYSIATIGRLSAERGGPSTAAIRNKTGETYRALIQNYASTVNGKIRKVHKTKYSAPLNGVFEGVNDPVLKVRIKLLLAEIESLRGQLIAARHLANQASILDLNSILDGKHSTLSEARNNKEFDLTYQEILALEAAISKETLDHWGWSIDSIGRMITSSGQVVFRAGFVSAIKKAIDNVAGF